MRNKRGFVIFAGVVLLLSGTWGLDEHFTSFLKLTGSAIGRASSGCGGSGSSEPSATTLPGDDPRQGCLIAYESRSFRGYSYELCDNGQTSGDFLDDDIESIRVPEGFAVEACDDRDGGGHCFTYWSDVGDLKSFNNKISYLRSFPFDPSSFRMLIASDPQLWWSECSEVNPEACQNDGGSGREIGDATNTRHTDAMNALKNQHGDQLTGVILNGDLTAFGHLSEMGAYRAFYEDKLQMNLYPGLGNHDYENNINDCTSNSCATRMLRYLSDKAEGLNLLNFDQHQTEDFFNLLDPRVTYRGSLSYSFEIGDIHFIQLQNHPSYEVEFEGWEPPAPHRNSFTITNSYAWLKEDVARATAAGKRIVVNLHKPDLWDPDFNEALTDGNVIGIFVGHLHHLYGLQWTLNLKSGQTKRPPYPGPEILLAPETVPVFFCGSALYGKFLSVHFTPNGMTVDVISSSSGSPEVLPERSVTFPSARSQGSPAAPEPL